MLDEEEVEFLDELIEAEYLYFGRDRVWKYVNEHFPDLQFSRRDIDAYLKSKKAWQLTKQAPKKEAVSQINITRPGYFSADLTGPFIEDFKTGSRYLCGFLDVATKQLYIKGIREKTPLNVVKALKELMAEHGFTPTVIQSDQGSEYKAEFLEFLESAGIKHFNSQVHSPWQNNIERHWGTLKGALRRYQLETGDKSWLEPSINIAAAMNNTYQRTIRTNPNDALEVPEEVRLQRFKSKGKVARPRSTTSAFHVNDIVRKRVLKKGKFQTVSQTYTDATYIISEVLAESSSKVVRYKLKENDGSDKLLLGTYDVTDLLLVQAGGGILNRYATQQDKIQPEDIQVGLRSGQTVRDEVEIRLLEKNTETGLSEVRDTRRPAANDLGEFLVEKILRRKKMKGKWLYEIKWIGFPSDDNTWEPASNLENAKEMLKEFNSTRRN